MGLKDKPSILIPQDVYDKIMWWVNHAEGEVSGMGTVVYNAESNQFTVDNAILLDQKCGAASTELDAGAVGRAEYATRDHPGEGMRWWWHSHVNMNVFWSGTDTATIEELGDPGWFLATVFNKREESKSCIYQGKPFPFFVDDIELYIATPPPADEVVKAWREEFESKVRPNLPVYPGRTYGYNNWASTPPLDPLPSSIPDITYSRAEGEKWLNLHRDLMKSIDNDTLTGGELALLSKRLDDIEDILDTFIYRNILTSDQVYGSIYGTYD